MTAAITAILGASDPEMSAIERILRDAGARVLYAAGLDATRVHPGNAYRAVCLLDGRAEASQLPEGEVWLIECAPARGAWWHDAVASARRIDHHRPGDPGYGRPPAEFLAASSLGQTIAALRLPPRAITREMRMVAAADHCLAAAYAGKCPGIGPETLARWRAESRAQHRGCSVSQILADIDRATAALRAAPTIEIAGVRVADLGTTVPEAPEAAARIGMPFLATVVEPDYGRRKRVLQAAPYDVVAAWLAEMQAEGHETYGDPARGFAGAYIP